jgi:hypothetical protein
MKLVAITRVRNELDIIEAFVRHHCEHFSKLIVLDDGSRDGTYEVLRSLQAAGSPVVLLREPTVGYEQSRCMTLLLRMALDQFGADWVAPLDADEFIEPQGGLTLREALAGCEPALLAVQWSNFVWSPDDDNSPERNPVLRLRARLPPLPPAARSNKLLVPAWLVDASTRLSQGNHQLVRNGEVLPTRALDAVALCHFPVRSVAQYASKVAVGYLQYSAMADWDRQIGRQYIEPFRALLTGGLPELERRMCADSRNYLSGEGAPDGDAVEPRDAPLRYRGGPITLTRSREVFLPNVLHYAEAIAKALADNSSRREQAVAGDRPDCIAEDNPVLRMRLSQLELELAAARKTIFLQSVRLSSRTFRLIDRVHRRLAKMGLRPRAIADWLFWLLSMTAGRRP